jgi:DNA-binding NtrC family response regulator
MNPRKVIGDSGESTLIDRETYVDQAGASASEASSVSDARPEELAAYRERSDDPARRLKAAQLGSEPGPSTSLTLDEIIKQTLIRVLRETRGNRRRTAIMLGISRSTLYRMLERYGIDHVGRETSARKPRADRMAPGTTV